MPVTEKEAEILKSAEKILLNNEEEKLFKENLRKMLDGDKQLSSRPLIIGKTPNALAICGADSNLNVQITKKVIDKCLRPEIRDENGRLIGKTGHGLTEQQLVDSLNNIKKPAIILQGSRDDSLVAITDLQDNKGRQIITIIQLDQSSNNSVVNNITSVYGRTELAEYIKNNFRDGKVLAINKEKANELHLSIGKSYPKAAAIISFDNSIAYSTQNVKYSERNVDKEKLSLLGKLKENEGLVKSDAQDVKAQTKSKADISL